MQHWDLGGKIIEVLSKYMQASCPWRECSPAAGPLLFSAAAGDGTVVKTPYCAQMITVLTCLTMRQKKGGGYKTAFSKRSRGMNPPGSWTVAELNCL